MVNKSKNLIFGIFIFLVVSFIFTIFFSQTFLSAQSNLVEITEVDPLESYYSYYGENAEVIDNNLVCKTGIEKCIIEFRKGDITATIEATQGIKISPLGKISVVESGSDFSINGNSFENIKSGGIILNMNTGEIANADFFTNENLGNYNINGNEFDVPANSRFVYSPKKGFELAEGTEIKNIATEIKIQGTNLVYFKGNEQHSVSGNLNFDEDGNTFVKIGEKVVINGVSLENEGKGLDFPIFFDKNTAEASKKSEYLILEPSKNFFAFKEVEGNLPRNIRIEFNKENYLFGDLMDEKDYLFVGKGGVDPGYLEITRQGKNLPVVKTRGYVEINPDEKRFLFEGENIIFKTGTNAWPIPEDLSKISGTVPMVFESQDRKVVGLIPDNNDKRFYWTTKGGKVSYGSVSGAAEEQLGVELPDFITKSWAENSEVTQDRTNTISVLANNPEIQKIFTKSLVAEKNLKKIYETKLEKIENEIFADSGREQELRKATDKLVLGIIKDNEFEEIIKQGKDPSITWAELEEKVGKETSNYVKNAIKDRVNLYSDIYSELPKDKDLDIILINAEEEILKVMSPDELKALNECKSRGNSFDLCFDENYKYLGLKTFLCIKDPKYCPTMTSYQFNKMRTK